MRPIMYATFALDGYMSVFELRYMCSHIRALNYSRRECAFSQFEDKCEQYF